MRSQVNLSHKSSIDIAHRANYIHLLMTLALLCEFVQSCSAMLEQFRNFPFGFVDSLAKSYAVAVDVVAEAMVVVAISVRQFDSVTLSGSPFRLITFISTSTPCSFNATDYMNDKVEEWVEYRESN